MALIPPAAGFRTPVTSGTKMVLTIAAVADQLGDADVAFNSSVSSNAGAVTYAWTVTDPDGADATASLDDDTTADPTLDLSAYAGKVGGKWTAVCTATDSLGSVTTKVEWQVGTPGGWVIDTYDFSGTLDVSGSTVSVGGVTWTLDSGTWTSDADGVQINAAGSGSGAEVTATWSDLGLNNVQTFRIAVIFDDPLNMSTGTPTSTTGQLFELQAQEDDGNPVTGVGADYSPRSPTGAGALLRKSNPTETSAKALVTLSTITGFMFEVSGARLTDNGNAYFRAYYSTSADPSLDTNLTDWTQLGNGVPTGLQGAQNPAVTTSELALSLFAGSSAAAYSADIARVEVSALR